MKKYNFKFNLFSTMFFVMLIVLFLFILTFNVYGLINARLPETVPTKIAFVCISTLMLIFVLTIFFGANYFLEKEKLVLKFGFLKLLTIAFEDIRQVKHYPQYNELFVVYRHKSIIAAHRVCIDKKYFDEFVESVKK